MKSNLYTDIHTQTQQNGPSQIRATAHFLFITLRIISLTLNLNLLDLRTDPGIPLPELPATGSGIIPAEPVLRLRTGSTEGFP